MQVIAGNSINLFLLPPYLCLETFLLLPNPSRLLSISFLLSKGRRMVKYSANTIAISIFANNVMEGVFVYTTTTDIIANNVAEGVLLLLQAIHLHRKGQ